MFPCADNCSVHPFNASIGILDDKEKLEKMQCFDKKSNTI